MAFGESVQLLGEAMPINGDIYNLEVLVYRTGRVTTVLVLDAFDNTGGGCAIRHPSDPDDPDTGYRLAFARALRELLKDLES